MTPQALHDKLWDSHAVHVEDDGTTLLYIDRHLVHEVTSPQAFEGLKLARRKLWRASANLATADPGRAHDGSLAWHHRSLVQAVCVGLKDR